MIVKGKTLKGKNRIKELGEVWMLVKTSETVLFADRPGPWGLIRPAKKGCADEERWIHLVNDADFDIVSLER